MVRLWKCSYVMKRFRICFVCCCFTSTTKVISGRPDTGRECPLTYSNPSLIHYLYFQYLLDDLIYFLSVNTCINNGWESSGSALKQRLFLGINNTTTQKRVIYLRF